MQCDSFPLAFNSAANPLIYIINYPSDQLWYIGEKVTVEFLVAVDGDGVSNNQFTDLVTVQGVPIPAQLDQSDTFVYSLTFYAASVLNSTTIDVTVPSEISEGSLMPVFH